MNILEEAIKHYGAKMQVVVAMEEMAELTKELSKAYRGDADYKHIAEEIADVEIMLEQLKIIFGCDGIVCAWKRIKMQRLKERLESDTL